jgi:hypothetical protein
MWSAGRCVDAHLGPDPDCPQLAAPNNLRISTGNAAGAGADVDAEAVFGEVTNRYDGDEVYERRRGVGRV